jgi:O-antigen ligase
MLGMVLTALGVFLIWVLIECRRDDRNKHRAAETFVYLMLLAMLAWLLTIADCATAVVSTTIGAAILVLLKYPSGRSHIKAWLALLGLCSAIIYSFNFGDYLLTAVGRDVTLTGRTAIWDAVLNEETNPLIGVGFYSFWLGGRAERLSAAYYYVINESHNGYLELYLDGGVIALSLYVAFLAASATRTMKSLALGNTGIYSFRLSFLITAVVYAFTEAVASRLDLVWFVLVLVTVDYSRRRPQTVHSMARVELRAVRNANLLNSQVLRRR